MRQASKTRTTQNTHKHPYTSARVSAPSSRNALCYCVCVCLHRFPFLWPICFCSICCFFSFISALAWYFHHLRLDAVAAVVQQRSTSSAERKIAKTISFRVNGGWRQIQWFAFVLCRCLLLPFAIHLLIHSFESYRLRDEIFTNRRTNSRKVKMENRKQEKNALEMTASKLSDQAFQIITT